MSEGRDKNSTPAVERAHSSRLRYAQFRRQIREAKGDSGGDEKPHAAKPGGKEARRRHLREYRAWLWPYRGMIALVFILAIASAGLGLFLPMLTREMIDGAILLETFDRSQRLNMLARLGLWTVAAIVASEAIDAYRDILMAVLNAKVIFRLRERLFHRLLRLPLHELSNMKSGGIVSRMSGDVDSVTGLVQMAVITPGVAAIRVVLTLGALLFLSWKMALAAMALIPPLIYINMAWVHKVRPIYRSMRDDRSEVDARITESFGGLRIVRAFRRELKEEHDHAVGHHTIIRKQLLAILIQLIVTAGWGLIIPATSLVIVWFGGYLVVSGQATMGDIFAFQMYSFMLLNPVSQIVHSWNETQSALAAMERVFEIFDMPPEKPDPPEALDAPRSVERLEFDQVCFTYDGRREVIEDFTLSVPGGAVVALVGPSGAGKTTITDLVARFYDPTRGAIRLNGTDLRDLKLHSYRRLLAIVQQEVFLFDGPAWENIAYGRRAATMEEIRDAAEQANAAEFIEKLSNGYDTIIGERGVKLSGGQRQRLSIARAILADPSILILDEATSSLDSESEQLIQASLARLLKNRTTFVIAHRLSTITHADMIVVMKEGRLVELGDHASLMAAEGLYYDMVERQRRFQGGSLLPNR